MALVYQRYVLSSINTKDNFTFPCKTDKFKQLVLKKFNG